MSLFYRGYKCKNVSQVPQYYMLYMYVLAYLLLGICVHWIHALWHNDGRLLGGSCAHDLSGECSDLAGGLLEAVALRWKRAAHGKAAAAFAVVWTLHCQRGLDNVQCGILITFSCCRSPILVSCLNATCIKLHRFRSSSTQKWEQTQNSLHMTAVLSMRTATRDHTCASAQTYYPWCNAPASSSRFEICTQSRGKWMLAEFVSATCVAVDTLFVRNEVGDCRQIKKPSSVYTV